MMRIATALESCALDLKHEALEWMSTAVGGTAATALWDDIARCFAVRAKVIRHPQFPRKNNNPFIAVDPAPTHQVALGHDEVMDPSASYKDPLTKAIQALTISTGESPLADAASTSTILKEEANSAVKWLRSSTKDVPDLVTLDQAVPFVPLDKDHVSITDVPEKWLIKMTGKVITAFHHFPLCLPPSQVRPPSCLHSKSSRTCSHVLGSSGPHTRMFVLPMQQVVDPCWVVQSHEGPPQSTGHLPFRC